MADTLLSRLSSYFEVQEGNNMCIVRSFSESDATLTKVFHTPISLTLAALETDRKIDVCPVLNVKQVYIRASNTVDVKFGSSTNTAVRLRKGENGYAMMTALMDFVHDPTPLSTTGMFVTNPNNEEVEIEFIVVGT